MDALRGTPYKSETRGNVVRVKKGSVSSRVSIGESFSFNVTRREGERMHKSRSNKFNIHQYKVAICSELKPKLSSIIFKLS